MEFKWISKDIQGFEAILIVSKGFEWILREFKEFYKI